MARSTFAAATTAIAGALLLSADSAAAAEGFAKIATDFGEGTPTGVVLPSICIGNFVVPKPMYTFEPAGVNETVSIETNPPNLVESGFDEDSGLIYFKFNQTVVPDSVDAGVIIKFPKDQLESINICCTQVAQIKPGFTNFKSLVASTSSEVDASFGTQEGDLAVIVQSNAVVNVKVNATEKSRVGVAGETKATVSVDGDVTVLNCLEESTCMLKGGIISGKADKASTITATSCEDIEVKSEATCLSEEPKVVVTTDKPVVFSGVKEDCYGGDDLFGVNGPAPTDVPSASPAPTVSAMPSEAPVVAPTSAPSAPPSSGQMTRGAVVSAFASGAALLLLLWQ